MPSPTEIEHIEEPYVKATVIVPNDYVGPVMEISQEKRGVFKTMDYLDVNRVMVIYHIPLSEIIYDYFDKLKSATRGYASLDYEMTDYQTSKLVKLDILLNGDPVDALSTIVHVDKAAARGRQLAEKLKTIIPRQMFEIPIQAAVGNKIIARENVRAMRKDVLAKCYGGDITRKRKLLENRKKVKTYEGCRFCRSSTRSFHGDFKNRLMGFGIYIHIPFCKQNVFTAILLQLQKSR